MNLQKMMVKVNLMKISMILEYFSQNDIGINLPNQFERDVSEVQNHDVHYFRTLDNEEDIFMSTCESEMEYCSVWSEDATKDLKKGIQGARHAQFGVPLLDLHLSNNLPSRLLPPSFQRVAANSQLPNVINKYQNDKVIRPENSGVLQLKCIPYP
uniref:Uncharacterized protein n=1 Tax=Solanum tuberosum TaxID=4113 RepID=M1BY81_SOLTU